MPRIVNREELQVLLADENQTVLLEALPEKYYRQNHLPGARHLPPDRVAESAPNLIADRNARIVVYCASATCQNSHAAASDLEELGYTDVSIYADGKSDWIEAGLAVDNLATTPVAG